MSEMYSVFGDVAYADRAERIAFNALGAAWGGGHRHGAADTSDMNAHQYFSCANQVEAVNASDHVYPGRPTSESYASWHNGCCTSNNGQGWPKLALRVVFTTPYDGGVAVGSFAPVRAQLSATTVLVVDTEYPATDVVSVLLHRTGQDAAAAATPLRVRVPSWAVSAEAYLNGVLLPPARVQNGTMLHASCTRGTVLCNVTLVLNPKVVLESWFGDSVSLFRGPLLFAADLGRNYTLYSPACEQPPFASAGCPDLGPERRPVKNNNKKNALRVVRHRHLINIEDLGGVLSFSPVRGTAPVSSRGRTYTLLWNVC